MTTAWMWRAGQGINALKLDVEQRRLRWFDEVGCACGDSSAEQTVAEYRQRGAPGFTPPEDVLAEIDEALRVLEQGG